MPRTISAPARHPRRFDRLAADFASRYVAAARHGGDDLIADEWHERNRPLERDVLPRPRRDFIRHPSVLYSMFVDERYVEPELPALVEAFGGDLARLLAEDAVGDPPLVDGHDGSYATSSNRIHHLHHLWRFTRATGAAAADMGTVVEWGGGYGSLARVFGRLHGGSPTYVIVDTPLFSCLQWLYLASVLGEEAVTLCTEGPVVEPGRITLVPVGLAEALEVDADLFVSTWALNESPPALQERVASGGWFGARHLLMGMHDGVELAERALAAGARSEPVGGHMPGQRYVLR